MRRGTIVACIRDTGSSVVEHQIQRWASSKSEELPATTLTHPFGPSWDVWKVRGKVFALLSEHNGEPIVNLKASPDDVLALVAEYEQITVGYHMNKRHWISLRPGDQLDERHVHELVVESYLLVVEGLPRKDRPVDIERFAPFKRT